MSRRAKWSGAVAPERLRRVAVGLFAKQGFAATGIREIANAAAVTPSLLYHYWPTKEDLLFDIMANALTILLSTVEEALTLVDSPPAQLAVMIETHAAGQALNADEAIVVDTCYRSLTGPSYREVMALRDRYEDLWREVIERGHSVGMFRTTDTRIARLALLEMCNGVARWYSPAGPLPLEQIAGLLADAGLGAVGAQQQGKPISIDDLDTPSPSALIALVQRALDGRQRRGGLRVAAS